MYIFCNNSFHRMLSKHTEQELNWCFIAFKHCLQTKNESHLAIKLHQHIVQWQKFIWLIFGEYILLVLCCFSFFPPLLTLPFKLCYKCREWMCSIDLNGAQAWPEQSRASAVALQLSHQPTTKRWSTRCIAKKACEMRHQDFLYHPSSNLASSFPIHSLCFQHGAMAQQGDAGAAFLRLSRHYWAAPHWIGTIPACSWRVKSINTRGVCCLYYFFFCILFDNL